MYFILSGMFSDLTEVKLFGHNILLKSGGAVKWIFNFLRCELFFLFFVFFAAYRCFSMAMLAFLYIWTELDWTFASAPGPVL